MNSVKGMNRMNKRRDGVCRGEYVTMLGLFALVIIGALAAAATTTTEGYVLLDDGLYSLTG